MKLLTFLGLGRYEPVTYHWGERECHTPYFARALFEWLQPGKVLVFVTPEVEAHANWTTLQTHIPADRLEPVRIPSGRNPEEIWQIFEILRDQVTLDEPITLDVTHAFRSLPLLALLAVEYARAARGVHLEQLVYGAFEAREEGRVPVFDLTPFVQLFDWLTAANVFRRSGDARDLAELLNDSHQAARRDGELPRHLSGVARWLTQLSDALLLSRPAEIRARLQELERRLVALHDETPRWARPFTLLLDETTRTYQDLACEAPLEMERRLIGWYLDHGHLMQAVILADEWLASWTLDALNLDQLADREGVRIALAGLLPRAGSPRGDTSGPLSQAILSLPGQAHLLAACASVDRLRNDLAHCGMRTGALPAQRIREQALGLREFLEQLLVRGG